MALSMKGIEWLTDIADPFSKKFIYASDGQPLGEFLDPTFLPTTELPFSVDRKFKIPSIIGGNFLNKLKGLVFDFTPGKERVGFIPRYDFFGSKTGLVNPLHPPKPSNGLALRVYPRLLFLSGGFAITVTYLLSL
jgi:hypothetical protein